MTQPEQRRGSPDDPRWLSRLVQTSPLLPDPALRQHWLTLIPWLDVTARYELAAALLEAEQAIAAGPS
jgi:hypothetical protein